MGMTKGNCLGKPAQWRVKPRLETTEQNLHRNRQREKKCKRIYIYIVLTSSSNPSFSVLQQRCKKRCLFCHLQEAGVPLQMKRNSPAPAPAPIPSHQDAAQGHRWALPVPPAQLLGSSLKAVLFIRCLWIPSCLFLSSSSSFLLSRANTFLSKSICFIQTVHRLHHHHQWVWLLSLF